MQMINLLDNRKIYSSSSASFLFFIQNLLSLYMVQINMVIIKISAFFQDHLLKQLYNYCLLDLMIFFIITHNNPNCQYQQN
ncbi:expressed protein [Phakopsora pachyrhizi]|uniref:Expressed protein n=1 Tax=Phakopsora pachyrhizi TaxID=170000 RepID=A0AAV0AU79_PHAPC|nr:expressed protein [Phakopsora pachyrhizi]CAH7671820.1 expressed protein [Phakopsora pachyrhizi]